MAQFTRVPQIRKGAPVTARLLNTYAGAINTLQTRLGAVEDQIVATDQGDRPEISTSDEGTSTTEDQSVISLLDMLSPSETATADFFFVEESRQTETVRVEDPDDPDTFVDVERIVVVSSRSLTGRRLVQVFTN